MFIPDFAWPFDWLVYTSVIQALSLLLVAHLHRFANCEPLSSILLVAWAPNFIGWQIENSYPQQDNG